MKTKLFYFTGTGNTLSVAKKLAAELGDAVVEPMTKANPVLGPDADAVGLVFPVYCWTTPNLVAAFIDKLQNISGKYIFAVCTYGGSPLGTLFAVSMSLKKKGVGLDAGWGIKQPGNYVPLYGVPSPERRKKMMVQARAKISAIATAVKNRRESAIEGLKFPLVANLLIPVTRGMMSHFSGADKNFHATDACNGCGICARVCPVHNIAMQDKRPVWNHRCEQCLACLHWCPQAAIQYGKTSAKRGRYHHPDVSLQEMYDQQVSEASLK